MILTLKIKDETYQELSQHNPTNPRLVAEQILEKFKELGPRDRVVILPQETRARLEALYGSSIDDPAKFADWVERLLSLRVDQIEVPLKAAHHKYLTNTAVALKRDVGEFVKERVKFALDREFGLA